MALLAAQSRTEILTSDLQTKVNMCHVIVVYMCRYMHMYMHVVHDCHNKFYFGMCLGDVHIIVYTYLYCCMLATN